MNCFEGSQNLTSRRQNGRHSEVAHSISRCLTLVVLQETRKRALDILLPENLELAKLYSKVPLAAYLLQYRRAELAHSRNLF